MKKTLAILLAFVMLFALAACGGGKTDGPEEAGFYTLYEMTASGETFDNDFLSSVGMDALYTLELNADGSGSLTIEGDISPVTWKDGKITVTASGAVYDYEYQGGKITLTETTGDTLVFQKTDAPSGTSASKPTADQQLSELQSWWSGDWYGWWHVTSADGYWEWLEGNWYDCCANIVMDSDTAGYIEIWDEDGSRNDEFMATCDVSFGAGTTDAGAMMSEDGYFWLDNPIEHADWIVDPGASVVSDYEHMICLDGSYEDPENGGGFDYKIYLRPWGMDWEDVAAVDAELLPSSYEWYLSAIDAGEAMPDAIGGGSVMAPGEVPDSQTEPQGGASDPNASAVDGTYQAPVYGDYGLSKAAATGVVPLTDVEKIQYYAESEIGSAYYDVLYTTMNYVHGKPLTDDPRWETGVTHVYQWSAESGEYATLVFEVTNYNIGIEKLQSVETSPGLFD